MGLFDGQSERIAPRGHLGHDVGAQLTRLRVDAGGETRRADVDPFTGEGVFRALRGAELLASVADAALASREPGWRNFAGGGLRDTTRIAGSDPKLWRTILEQNRDEVLRALRAYQDELHGLERALANRDWFEVQALLERGRAFRDQFRPSP